MSGQITQPPRGLLSLFGISSNGKVPDVLLDQIVPTFDIAQLCLLNRELIIGSNNTSPGTGGLIFTGSRVPPGELWYVWSAGVRSATLAGESLRLSGCFEQNGALLPAGPRGEIGGAAAEQLGLAIGANFWLGSGSGLGVVVEKETGLAKSLNWYAVIVRLRI